MTEIKIPYDRSFLTADIPDGSLAGILESKAHNFQRESSQEEIVHQALDNPIGSSTLEELVRDKKNMVIITSDHTRPVPSKITLPILLQRIRKANPNIDITILIATGFHRPSTRDEMIDKYGQEIVDNEKLVIHESGDQSNMVKVGILPSGGELWLNRVALETELLIAEGFIEPHFFAGFSGGRKSVLPGIAGTKTVLANHNSKFIASSYARTGILENNPIHKDMLWAAQQAKLAFILNVVINSEKEVISAFSGDSKLAHEEGVRFVMELSKVKRIPGDIVITSNGGYPLDQNIYQAVKGMTAAEACCKEDSIIIIASSCNDGHGGESFYKNMAEAKSPREVLDRVIQIPADETVPDQWEFQILARILDKYHVILVTDQCDPQIIKDMHIDHAHTMDEALKRAFGMKGADAKVTVIPDGVSVVVTE